LHQNTEDPAAAAAATTAAAAAAATTAIHTLHIPATTRPYKARHFYAWSEVNSWSMLRGLHVVSSHIELMATLRSCDCNPRHTFSNTPISCTAGT
jgi:Tfp pilus assembly major pilin PilA